MKVKPRPGYERKSIAHGSAWHWVRKKKTISPKGKKRAAMHRAANKTWIRKTK